MPLPEYGVAIGTFQSFTRDPQHDFGHWYHGHLTLNTPDGPYQTALDVDAPSSIGVGYRVVDDLTVADIPHIQPLTDGFHPLPSAPDSGALDYARSPMLQDQAAVAAVKAQLQRLMIAVRRPPVGAPVFGPTPVDRLPQGLSRLPVRVRAFPWVASDGDNALDALEPYLQSATRIYVFGQRFTTGQGVHDVHMNQGDPVGSQWYATDGIWQDGAVLCEQPDGKVIVWQVKFNTQSLHTDGNGHPI